ncbi:MAG: hypothetical protein ACOC1X_02085 [Promethearchaeota archaeon]
MKSLKEIIENKENWRKDSPDKPPCAKCGKVIKDGAPIRMWTEHCELEISFHLDCLNDNDMEYLKEVFQ